jgi:hypothetical protein
MKNFQIEVEVVELYHATLYYEVEANSEREAIALVKDEEVDWIDRQGGDYSDFNKYVAEMYLKGDLEFVEISSVKEVETKTELLKRKLQTEKERKEKELKSIEQQLKLLNS